MRLSERARRLAASCEALWHHADDDGVVAIPPLGREEGAAERVRRLLADAYPPEDWDEGRKLGELLAEEAAAMRRKTPFKSLEDYLRNGFFERHARVFHHRPFVWHLWDGLKDDGFGVLVNAHRLCDGETGRQTLSKVIYTHLGEWIRRQDEAVKAEKPGAERRLAAATALKKKLELILEGEPPYDVFVRWKPLSGQAVGWDVDVNDGVRMNIRPFVEADVLRKKVGSLKWTKDRGNEPKREPRAEWPWFYGKDGKFKGERVNDVHLTLAEKRAALEGVEA